MSLNLKFSTTFLFAIGALFFADPALAAICPAQIIPECNWAAGETYGFGAFVEIVARVLQLIWCIIGSIALAMFVLGGFWWLTARGEEQQVKKGWDTLINAGIGVLIVLGSWIIINTIILFLTSPGQWDVAKVFNVDWTSITEDSICVGTAALSKGTVERSDQHILSGPVPRYGEEPPPEPEGSPSPTGSPSEATGPAYESPPVKFSNPELFEVDFAPITPAQGESISVSVPTDPRTEAQKLADAKVVENIEIVATPASFLIPGGVAVGILRSIGGRLVIAGAKQVGSKLILREATMQVVGCTKSAPVCRKAALQLTDGINKGGASKVNFHKTLDQVIEMQQTRPGVYEMILR